MRADCVAPLISFRQPHMEEKTPLHSMQECVRGMMLANLGLQSTRKHLCSMDVNMPCVWPMDTEPLPAAAGAKPCLAPPLEEKNATRISRA